MNTSTPAPVAPVAPAPNACAAPGCGWDALEWYATTGEYPACGCAAAERAARMMEENLGWERVEARDRAAWGR